MRNGSRSSLALTAFVGVCAGIGFMNTAMAVPDKFTITCEEVDQTKPNNYECWIKEKLPSGEGPKKKYKIVTDSLSFFGSEEGLVIDACPGWFFIGGKWVFVQKCI